MNTKIDLISVKEKGSAKLKISEKLFHFDIDSAYSENVLERNLVSFHRCLSDSLREAVALVFDRVLSKEIGEEVDMTVKFKLIGIPSDGSIKPKGRIFDNLKEDPSMHFLISVFKPDIE